MPLRPLPARIVQRLRRASKRLNLAKMRNIDPRKHDPKSKPNETDKAGGRIREMNVKRNTREKIILKRTHGHGAWEKNSAMHTINIAKRVAQKINDAPIPKEISSISFKVHVPHGYQLEEHLLAMSKLSAPTLRDLTRVDSVRGASVIASWRKKGWDVKKMIAELRKLSDHFEAVSQVYPGNMFVIKVNGKKHRYEFVPAMDIF